MQRFELDSLPDAVFGASVRFPSGARLADLVSALESKPSALPDALHRSRGLLVIEGLHEITEEPELLVRLSRLFGPEVENYRENATPKRMVHDSFDEIFVISNLPPMNFEVPEPPEPRLTEDGRIPVQYPHRTGWHTDQSFRRPPPDISLFYARQPCPRGQGQTLYADDGAAYDALPPALAPRVEGLEAVHAIPWTGRGREAVRAGETPKPLLAHQASQHQPVVRVHPVTGKRSLYLCEEGQIDWILGPFCGLETGPEGEGAALLDELIAHCTQRRFTYVHDWTPGDLVIHDNRNLLHSATWFDAARYGRVMWRTTVMGNPGEQYAGEAKSWIPADGVDDSGDLF